MNRSRTVAAAALALLFWSPAARPQDYLADGTRERLVAAVRKMLGDERGNYISMPPAADSDRGLTFSQFRFAFAGIPGPMVDLQDGRKLFVGSAPHDAQEKAFVVTEGDRSTLAAVALMHQSCFGARYDRLRKQLQGCPPRPILTFLVPQGHALDPQVREDVVGWVKQYEKESSETFRNSSPGIRKVMTVRAFDVAVQKTGAP